MIYNLKDTYYDCRCGGKFYVDLSAQTYGVSPTKYHYECDQCKTRKVMPNKDEMRLMAVAINQ